MSVLEAAVFTSVRCFVAPPEQMDFRDDCHSTNSLQCLVLSRAVKDNQTTKTQIVDLLKNPCPWDQGEV